MYRGRPEAPCKKTRASAGRRDFGAPKSDPTLGQKFVSRLIPAGQQTGGFQSCWMCQGQLADSFSSFLCSGLILKWPHRPGYKCLLLSKGSLYSIQPYDSCEILVSAPRNGCFGRMGAEKKEESPPRPYLARNSPTRCFTRRRLPCGRRGHACCTRALQKKKVE